MFGICVEQNDRVWLVSFVCFHELLFLKLERSISIESITGSGKGFSCGFSGTVLCGSVCNSLGFLLFHPIPRLVNLKFLKMALFIRNSRSITCPSNIFLHFHYAADV